MKYDYLIKEVNLYYGNGELEEAKDVAIKDGYITEVGTGLSEADANRVIDGKGRLLSPGFVDSHMHIDINYTYDYELAVPSLIGGARVFKSLFDRCDNWTKKEIYDDIYARSARTLDNCMRHGTTAVKTNITYFPQWKGLAFRAMLDLKEAYQDRVDLYNLICFTNPVPDEIFEKEVVPEWEALAAEGKVDFIGGYPHKYPNGKEIIDGIFERAKKYDRPIDIHCDESDVPNLDCFSYVLDKIIETGMEGKVTFGHVTALSAKMLDEDIAQELIKKAARAKANITSLTSCNMYLMQSTRRGPTRVKELMDAGVNVAVASDDVREVLRPYGNCDLLEEALLTAQVHKMGTKEELRQVFDMISYNPARNTLLEDYGVRKGCKADLVLIDANTPEEAILKQSAKLYVFKHGRVVARDGKLEKHKSVWGCA